jgi:hypothetical protein
MMTVHGASQQIWMTDVRFGSKADIGACPRHVRFASKSGHQKAAPMSSTTGVAGSGVKASGTGLGEPLPCPLRCGCFCAVVAELCPFL